MRFLADESCDFAVVRALRSGGHDVVAICEVASGSDDETVMEMAAKDQRVLLTEDKDFGQLVYANAQLASGVILLRFPTGSRASVGTVLLAAVERLGQSLFDSFVVVRPGSLRIGRAFTEPHP